MTDRLSVSILGRNEIDCHGLHHILSDGGFIIEHCGTDRPAGGSGDWKDEPSHIVIVDNASAVEALACCTELRGAMRHARIVVMCDDCDVATVREAFAAGVDGILAKHIGSKPLISALQLIALGEKVMPSQFIEELVSSGALPDFGGWNSRKSLAHLSEREIEILRCLVAGDANKLIARKLGVAEATVKAHIKAILRKLQVGNRTQAAIWAINRGLDQDGLESDTVLLKQ